MARFKSTIAALEEAVEQQLRLVWELEAEKQALLQREQGLLSSLSTLQCSVSAIASKANSTPQASQPTPQQSAGEQEAEGGGASSSSSSGVAADTSLQPQPSNGSTRSRSHACVQQQLVALEQLLEGTMQQAMLQHSSCQAVSGELNSLHTSRTIAVLRELAADPGRALNFLKTPPEGRVQILARYVRQLGVLLPKYDNQPRFRAELETIVEDVVAHGLTYTWLDPEACTLVDMQLTNLETGESEPEYPPGFWQHVVQATEFTPEQKVSLHALYSRMQGLQVSLLAQHDALLQQVDQLQLQQQQEQQLFAQQAQELPILQSVQVLWWGKQYEEVAAGAAGQQEEQQQGQVATELRQPLQEKQSQCQQQQQQSVDVGGNCSRSTCPPPAPPASAIPKAPAAATSQQSSADLQRQHSTTPSNAGAGGKGRDGAALHHNSAGAALRASSFSSPHHLALFEPPLVADPATALLLPPSSADHRRLEAQLSAIRARLLLHEKLLACHLWNTCTLKQLATIMVASWPFQPDSLAMCNALEQLGW